MLAMAGSAMVTLAAVGIGLGLSIVLTGTGRQQDRHEHPGTIATVVQVYAADDGGWQPIAQPSQATSVARP